MANQAQAALQKLRDERNRLELLMRSGQLHGSYGRQVHKAAQTLDGQIAAYDKTFSDTESASLPLTGVNGNPLENARSKGYAGSNYDPNTDLDLQALQDLAQQGDPNALENLRAYVTTQSGKNKTVADRAFAETGKMQAYDTSRDATIAAAQPILQQELSRLGILHGGALNAGNQQLANEMTIARGNSLDAYRTGASESVNALTTDQMKALNDLRSQQRAQAIAGFMQSSQNNSSRHQADRMLPYQIGGSVLGALGQSFGTKGIW